MTIDADKTLIYHNPRCSKSRQSLQLLYDNGVEANVVEYLKQPPDAATLEHILNLLGLEPRELMRRHESIYKELDLDNEAHSRASLIQAMVEHPALIERPIVISQGKAVIGRPPERILEIIS